MDKEWLMDLTINGLIELIRTGRATPLDSVQGCLSRIKRLNKYYNAFVLVCEEEALREAERQTRELKEGKTLGVLAGVPLGVKDLEDVKGLVTTYGSLAFKDNVATQDSVQVSRLKAAGAIVVGKTNTPIFGSQGFSNNKIFGATLNPWGIREVGNKIEIVSLTSGGSSGGASAALSGSLLNLVTAADGGGSIRIPAGYVGAFGLKPTRGLVPVSEGQQFGSVPYFPFVHFGPLTKSVLDAALILDITAGYHPHDPYSLPKPPYSFYKSINNVNYTKQKANQPQKSQQQQQQQQMKKLKIAFSKDLGYVSYVDPIILKSVEDGLKVWRSLGHTVEYVDITLPDVGQNWGTSMSSQQAVIIGEYLDDTNAKRLEAGNPPLELEKSLSILWESASQTGLRDLSELMKQANEMNHKLSELFSIYDILITPALPVSPFSASGPSPSEPFSDPFHFAGFLYPFNVSGHPACVVRCGMDTRLPSLNLPISMQLVAERHQDLQLLMAAREYEIGAKPFDSWPIVPKL